MIASVATSEAGLLSYQPAQLHTHSAPLALRSAPLVQTQHHIQSEHHVQPLHNVHLTHVPHHITDLHTTHAFHTVPLQRVGPLAQVSSLVHAPPLNQLNAAHLIHFAPQSQVPISPYVHELLPQVKKSLAAAQFSFHSLATNIVFCLCGKDICFATEKAQTLC